MFYTEILDNSYSSNSFLDKPGQIAEFIASTQAEAPALKMQQQEIINNIS